MAPAARSRVVLSLLLGVAAALCLAACSSSGPEPTVDARLAAAALIPHFLHPDAADLAVPTTLPVASSPPSGSARAEVLESLSAAAIATTADQSLCKPHRLPALATASDRPAASQQIVGYAMRDRVFDVPTEKSFWGTQAVRVFPSPAEATSFEQRVVAAVRACTAFVDDDLSTTDSSATSLRSKPRFQLGWLRSGNLVYAWTFELPQGATRVDLAARIIADERARLVVLRSLR